MSGTLSTEPGSLVRCPACEKLNRLRPVASGVPRCGSCGNTLPWVVDADVGTFEAETTCAVPVVVDFWAPWCAPCRMVSPALDGIARANAGGLKVVKVNVDDSPALASRFGAQGIPLLVLLKDGAEVDRAVGARPMAELERWLAPHLTR